MFKGAIVAIVTPFKNGQVDEDALRELIEFQIANGTDGIVPCGTTGESATLTHEEHDRVIEITIDAVKKRVPVIAGTGSNSTAEALRLTKHAYEAGADGALIVCPYYNRPTQEGLYQHYKMISRGVEQTLWDDPAQLDLEPLDLRPVGAEGLEEVGGKVGGPGPRRSSTYRAGCSPAPGRDAARPTPALRPAARPARSTSGPPGHGPRADSPRWPGTCRVRRSRPGGRPP